MFNFANIILAGAAMVVLVFALPPARRLIAELPAGRMRMQWVFLAGLVILSILGVAGYLILFWDGNHRVTDLLSPSLFLCAAIFTLLSVQLSLATIKSVRRMPTLERADVTDALTGLHSRPYFDSRMREELIRAERHGLAVSVMLLDVDRFASINDMPIREDERKYHWSPGSRPTGPPGLSELGL